MLAVKIAEALPVAASGPAAGAPLSLQKLSDNPGDVGGPRFRPLDRDGPADPLVPGEGGEAVPSLEGAGIREKRIPQIRRQIVDYAGFDLHALDILIVPIPSVA